MVSSKSHVTVRKFRIGEEPRIDEDVLRMTPAERLALQWEITKSAWAWKLRTFDEPPFRRDVARLIRRGR